MKKLEFLNVEMSRCEDEWRIKEREFECMKMKNNCELKNFNNEIILFKNALTLQHNEHEQEMVFNPIEQQNLYNQSISIRVNKFKKQFILQNLQLKNLTYEIERERNLYETKISFLFLFHKLGFLAVNFVV